MKIPTRFHQQSPLNVGVLGGGQLARMLVLKGQQLGLSMHVMSPSIEDPAAQVTPLWLAGSLDSEKSLSQFLAAVDYCTFESEFLNPIQLQRMARKSDCLMSPTPYLMGVLQDRLTQKDILDRYQIESADYAPVFHMDDLMTFFNRSNRSVVLKKRRFGYDGYGTHIIDSPKKLKGLPAVLKSNKEGFIVERKIKFARELAITLARSASGKIVSYPLVETKQLDSRCLWVKGPVSHRAIEPLILKLKKFLSATKYIGVITFELFDIDGKTLLVNEIAPRVHNSAHHTLESMSVDQFSMHLLCVVGAAISEPELVTSGFAMHNLLGTGKKSVSWSTPKSGTLHWYGKLENRKGRKLGHITALANQPELALKRATQAVKSFKL